MRDRPKVGEILVQAGIIDELQLASALGEQARWGRRLGMTLIKLGMVQEGHLVRALARQYDMPVASLAGKKIAPEVIALVPAKLAIEHGVVPLFVKKEGHKSQLFLGMEEPSDLGILDDLAFHTGMSIRPVMVGPTELGEAIDRYYNARPAPASPRLPDPLRAADTLSENNLRSLREEPAPTLSELLKPGPASAASSVVAAAAEAMADATPLFPAIPDPEPDSDTEPVVVAAVRPRPEPAKPIDLPTAPLPREIAAERPLPAAGQPVAPRVAPAPTAPLAQPTPVAPVASPAQATYSAPMAAMAPMAPIAPSAPAVSARPTPPAPSTPAATGQAMPDPAPAPSPTVSAPATPTPVVAVQPVSAPATAPAVVPNEVWGAEVARAIDETERTRLVAKAIAHLLIEKGILTLDELQARIEKMKSGKPGSAV